MLHAQMSEAGPGTDQSSKGYARTRQLVGHGVPATSHGASMVENRTNINAHDDQIATKYGMLTHNGTRTEGRDDRSARSRSSVREKIVLTLGLVINSRRPVVSSSALSELAVSWCP